MKQFEQNEEAVSPVIGVILMVAITVILAAVIAAFVFGMTGNMTTSKTVAATVTQQGDQIAVTYQGGADASTLQYLKITVGDASTATATYVYYDSSSSKITEKSTGTPTTTELGTSTLPVGASVKVAGGTDGRDHVVVVGHFTDGADQVVLDSYV